MILDHMQAAGMSTESYCMLQAEVLNIVFVGAPTYFYVANQFGKRYWLFWLSLAALSSNLKFNCGAIQCMQDGRWALMHPQSS